MAIKEVVEYLFKGDPTDLLQATRKVEGGLKGTGDAASKAEAEVSQSFSRMASNMRKAGDKMATAGKALTVGVTLPLAYALKGMADAAIQDQAALAKLEGQLQRTTGATRDQLDQVNEFIDKTAIAKGVADDQLRPAFERLARASGDTEQAQKDLNLALDVSRATGKDLDAVAQAMGRAYDGSAGALGRLGIATKDAEGKTLDMKTIMENMNRQFGGAADDWANTAAGRAEIARIKFDELQEQLGGALVPVMEDLVQVIGWVIDKFTALPDWLQKTLVGMVLLKGPTMWLAGTGAKYLGTYIAQLWAARTAAGAASGAVSGMASAASGAATGGLAALGAGAGSAATALGFKAGLGYTAVKVAAFLGQGLGLAKIFPYVGATIVASDQLGSAFGRLEEDGWSLSGSFKEIGGLFADAIEFITGPGVVRGIATVSDKLLSWVGINSDFKGSLENLFPSLKNVLGLTAGEQGGGEPGDAAYKWATGFKFFNDIIGQTPANIDPTVAQMERLAEQTGISAENMEILKAEFEEIQAYFDYEAAIRNVEQSLMGLNDWIAQTRQKNVEDGLGADFSRGQLLDLEGQIDKTAEALVSKLSVGLDQGKLSARQAVTETDNFIQQLMGVADQSPQTRDKIMEVVAQLQGVKSKYVTIDVETTQAQQRIANLKVQLDNLARGTRGPASFIFGALGAQARGNAAGGTMGFAAGGVYPQNSGGGITDKMTYVIGEGRNPREYVIPTDPQYSRRAQTLLGMASAELGVPRQTVSSTFAPTINVSGGSDPEATAAAVADAVEQAFARKKRREGSLAFS